MQATAVAVMQPSCYCSGWVILVQEVRTGFPHAKRRLLKAYGEMVVEECCAGGVCKCSPIT